VRQKAHAQGDALQAKHQQRRPHATGEVCTPFLTL
jgi:hypothetical protein